MKIQNLSIIFLVIAIPLIIILSYYLNLQQETLKLQAEYDTKLGEATKEGVKAYEINTVDWADWASYKTTTTERKEVKAAVNTFISSLANNLNISGTAKEYMVNYLPAVVATMYDGYYVYAPNYLPITKEDIDGNQLYYDESADQVTTDDGNGKNLPVYEPADGLFDPNIVREADYIYKDSENNQRTDRMSFVTDIESAKMEYKHILSNKIPYVAKYIKGNINVVINYTLDNRIYIYGTQGNETFEKDGYLVYFDTHSILPRITIKKETPNDKRTQNDIIVANTENNKKVTDIITNKTKIDSEILKEQIVYVNEITSENVLGTFKYIYDIKHEKLYYDEDAQNFFKLNNKVREYLINNDDVKVGDEEGRCRYKSVSVLIGEGDTTEYKKIYQVLNGRDKGEWYIDLKEEGEIKEEVDTEIKGVKLKELGLDDTIEFAAIYKDFSAINYYVEAYAFTNWVKKYLKDDVEIQQVKYNPTDNKYEIKKETLDGIFNISETNDPESEDSLITQHKRELMKNHIITNLDLAISNYSMGTYAFRVPVLLDSDWNQVFCNLSLITFFQGVPIGLKYYNNYAIATSTTNRAYVDPGELYFSGEDPYYHRVYCKECKNITYTGYRSVEYVLKEYSTSTGVKYYYQHDNYGEDEWSEKACYYCAVNKANYQPITTEMNEATERTYNQTKSYNEALARERYYQKEDIIGRVNVTLKYDYNTEGWEDVIHWEGLPEDQEVEIGVPTKISTSIPKIESNNQFVKYVFTHWEDINGKKYSPGDDIILTEDKVLYAQWRISLSQLNWKRDYVFKNESDAFMSDGRFNNTSSGNVTNGSISYIYIDEMPDGSGSRVQMIGNENKKGKGAAWAEFDAEFLDIAEFSFKYYLNSGHSFNAGGFLFNITETSDMLKGYMLSVNFNHEMLTAGNNKTGAIFEFEYRKGNNSEHFEYLNCRESFDLGKVNTSTNSEANGTITIKVEDNGYFITGTELSQDIFIPVNNINNPAVNKFGFFSDHFGSEHGHTCSNIGYFKLEDVVVTVVRDR